MMIDAQNDGPCAASGNQIDVLAVFRDKSVISAINRRVSWITVVYSNAKKYLAWN